VTIQYFCRAREYCGTQRRNGMCGVKGVLHGKGCPHVEVLERSRPERKLIDSKEDVRTGLGLELPLGRSLWVVRELMKEQRT